MSHALRILHLEDSVGSDFTLPAFDGVTASKLVRERPLDVREPVGRTLQARRR